MSLGTPGLLAKFSVEVVSRYEFFVILRRVKRPSADVKTDRMLAKMYWALGPFLKRGPKHGRFAQMVEAQASTPDHMIMFTTGPIGFSTAQASVWEYHTAKIDFVIKLNVDLLIFDCIR